MEENKPEPTNNEPVFENRIDLTELQNASQKIKEKLNRYLV